MIGWLFCSEACVNGVAGPAQALCEMQSVWQLFLEVVIYSRIPNLSQTFGIFVALVGSVVMAVDLPFYPRHKALLKVNREDDFIIA